MFKFRCVSPDDFPQILEWLSKKHVQEWWNDGDDTLEKVAAHYGATDETQRFILLDDEKPIGYFQYYFADDGAIGIDQFIGEETLLNQGIGEETIKIFVRMIVEKHHPSFILLDPSPDNKRAVRCYEKVGFRHYKTKTTADGNAVYLMRLETPSVN